MPVIDITLVSPTSGAVAYNGTDGRLYYGDGLNWKIVGDGNQLTVANMTVSAFTPIVGTQTIPFDSSLLTSGTPTAQPSAADPYFTINAGIFTCVKAGLYDISLSLSVDHQGFIYPYDEIVGLRLLNPTVLLINSTKVITNASNTTSDCVQVRLEAGRSFRTTVAFDSVNPVIVPTGTTILITKLE
ncbi:MAG TPA: hypothetical protein PKD85_01005, partial [Saprospiraceae bacterium]|nr:hypothetical protein [Saprospiraceae bacterium]